MNEVEWGLAGPWMVALINRLAHAIAANHTLSRSLQHKQQSKSDWLDP
jgi:hypothetical protein